MGFGIFGRNIRPATKEQEAEFSKAMKENKVGYKDGLVMVLTAFGVIVLPCLLILGVIALIVLLIFGAF